MKENEWTADSPRSRKVIGTLGWVLALTWIAVAIAAALSAGHISLDMFEQIDTARRYGLGTASSSENPFLVRLGAHTFVHDPTRLLLSLFLLYRLMPMAKALLTPQGFVRMYTLGTISTGLAYLVISKQTGNTQPLWGSEGALIACIGALSILAPGGLWFGRIPRNWFAIGLGGTTMLACGLGVPFWSRHNEISTETARLIPMMAGMQLACVAGLLAGIVYGVIAKILEPSPLKAG